MVEEIKNLCKKNNTTIKAIERELQLSNGSIRNWDKKAPAYDKLEKVAKRFNMTIDELIGNEMEEREKELLQNFRQASETGKINIIRIARIEAEENNRNPEQKYTNSEKGKIEA